MTYLASLETGARLSSKTLALAIGSPEPFLTKVMQALVGSHLAASRRGKAGGFELAKLPSEISMLDVIEAVEGPLNLTDCTECDVPLDQQCSRLGRCSAHPVWAEAQADLRRTLSRASLRDLAESARLQQIPVSIAPVSQEENTHAS